MRYRQNPDGITEKFLQEFYYSYLDPFSMDSKVSPIKDFRINSLPGCSNFSFYRMVEDRVYETKGILYEMKELNVLMIELDEVEKNGFDSFGSKVRISVDGETLIFSLAKEAFSDLDHVVSTENISDTPEKGRYFSRTEELKKIPVTKGFKVSNVKRDLSILETPKVKTLIRKY